VKDLKSRLGEIALVVCLDSGCGNYKQLWITNSLRGIAGGILTVKILKSGVHSGQGSGVAASSFRILRQLLERVEDMNTGVVKLPQLFTKIPDSVMKATKLAADEIGNEVWNSFPFVEGAQPITKDNTDLLLNRTWRPQLSITGVSGIPSLEQAGNVLRPLTSVKLSMRIPPGINAMDASMEMKRVLEKDPPYGSHVTFEIDKTSAGWAAPEMDDWLMKSVQHASKSYFDGPVMFHGEGGTIPFMQMLGDEFPKAQFVVTGVLGPPNSSNAHGPNEFLHLAFTKKIICAVANVLVDFAEHHHKK